MPAGEFFLFVFKHLVGEFRAWVDMDGLVEFNIVVLDQLFAFGY
jgi:hypothetical protein